ncbi:hypothetical protein UPYG_G00107660 [Umbra pygmaea]|uniref:SAM domain-containing protein n=1 Tax=Umbra pygmaea TaxID=75934 RepID=A0ABD0X272_UMBPY
MASSDFVRDKLIEWNLSKWIKNFEDEDINEEGFRLLTKQDYEHLIPKLGPRNIFRIKHKEYVKKCQKSCNDDKNIQVATLSSASIIKASKSSSGNKREKSSTVDEKIQVATLSSASIFTGSKISSGNAEITCQMAKGNHTPKKSKTKRTMTDVESNKKSMPITNTSEVNMPSTSMGHNPTGKRKSDLAQANKQSKKQKGYAASGTTSSLEMKKKAKVKEIMQSVRRKLSELPSTELIEYIKDKVEMLEKHKNRLWVFLGRLELVRAP